MVWEDLKRKLDLVHSRGQLVGLDCPACKWLQRVSFAYGNLACTTNHRVEREVVVEAATRLHGPCPEHEDACLARSS